MYTDAGIHCSVFTAVPEDQYKKERIYVICGDYSATVNLVTRKDVCPLPTVPKMMTILNGGTSFSGLRLAEAYQELTLDEEIAEVLTLTTPKGLH
ncbi:hypothetical protein M514_06473 [Trichuris suis]|uniref:Uncharacterized protein n=1 Tax=Trichuris suis TaxID=68888 RepID=A0A085M5Y0_9BILA|nr:hypothetical protein M513_06473 [Trichuris suis]KFD63527.1 hypothetical protein M514_06473 [Trichuris suis]